MHNLGFFTPGEWAGLAAFTLTLLVVGAALGAFGGQK